MLNYFMLQLQAHSVLKNAYDGNRASKPLPGTREILAQDSSYTPTEKYLLLEKFYLSISKIKIGYIKKYLVLIAILQLLIG